MQALTATARAYRNLKRWDSATQVYRQALDEYAADPAGYRCRPEWLEELAKLSHRGYTTGFLFGAPRDVSRPDFTR